MTTKFSVVSDTGKKFEFEFHSNQVWINERYVTVGLLYLDGGLFSTGVAVKHPNDQSDDRGVRLAFSRALIQGYAEFIHPITYRLKLKQVRDAWRKAYREVHG